MEIGNPVDNDPIDEFLKESKDGFWLFGYGSLVWKVDFPYVSSRTGYIKGYLRRFYQNSIDHRGTKDKPGRVCTLIPSNEDDAKVWGVAYKISAIDKDAVLKHLDYREKNGYKRYLVKFYPTKQQSLKHQSNENPVENDDSTIIDNILIYVATKDNESYAGPTDIDIIAKQIIASVGASGQNREYLYNLADTFRKLFPNETDDHLFPLEAKVKEYEKKYL